MENKEIEEQIEELKKEIEKLKKEVNRNCGNCTYVSRFSCGWTIYECGRNNDYRWFDSK